MVLSLLKEEEAHKHSVFIHSLVFLRSFTFNTDVKKLHRALFLGVTLVVKIHLLNIQRTEMTPLAN